MVEEFDLLEEVEVQFCDEECTESVWHGVNYSESLFCREKPKSELTVVIREEGMMYFLTADIKEFAGLCRKHGWYIVSHQRFSEAMEIGMCLMEAGKHAGWYSLGRSKEWNAMMRDVLNFTFEREKKMDFYPYETMFKGEVLIDGCRCHYLHDYYPTKIEKTNAHQKRSIFFLSLPSGKKARCSGFMQTFRNECSTLEFQSLEFLRFCKFLLFSKPLRD